MYLCKDLNVEPVECIHCVYRRRLYHWVRKLSNTFLTPTELELPEMKASDMIVFLVLLSGMIMSSQAIVSTTPTAVGKFLTQFAKSCAAGFSFEILGTK